MKGLKDFQRDTVAWVLERYFGADPTRRFLVADETGLGKSVVASGVVAAMIDRLERDDAVSRIDIIYICSNQDVAAQNLARLAGPQRASHAMSSRLTLLGRELPRITPQPSAAKPVNLVSFTPGTSFTPGWRTGKAEERAMLHYLLRNERWDGWQRKAALRIMQCTTRSFEAFQTQCDSFSRSLTHGIEPGVHNHFLDLARARGLLDHFDELIADIGRRSTLTDSEHARCKDLVGRLRTVLAEAGAHALEPDLVILDEFQRFRNLLDPELGGEAAELAHHLFNHQGARVLLLSATPYKPFTFAEEADTDDHHADLGRVLHFLCPDPHWRDAVQAALRAYRETVVTGAPTDAVRDDIRQLLLRVMCRTERPALGRHAMLAEHVSPAAGLNPTEIWSFVVMKRLGRALDAPVLLDYWKSAPYFLNFVEGYLLGDRLGKATQGGMNRKLRRLLDQAHLLDAAAIRAYAPIDLGNGKLRNLAAHTVERGWWQLLWLPPSMPHYALGPPFADAARQQITKRLVFSSWNATPTAVSALLSYEAERRVRHGSSEPPRSRLDYRISDQRVASMSTLALFWPHPVLAAACDPLAAARREPEQLLDLAAIESGLRQRLLADAPDSFRASAHTGEPQPWRAVLQWPGADPGISLKAAVEAATSAADPASDGGQDQHTGLVRHVQEALAVAAGDEPVCASPETVVDDLVSIGLHGPANIAWRALGRLVNDGSAVTSQGLWQAATVVAAGLRSLFNRPESMLLLDLLGLSEPYWRAVLRYCAAGGLQAVLDEYVHTLRSSASETPLDDHALLALAHAIHRALTLHSAPYSALDPLHPGSRIPITGRFALRYGGRGDDESQATRMSGVRHAFNSPFWPFVVTTTSAGQEGIDFHTYCSAVVHWNVPANPVDFEQREGRVHRFGGHAVRSNVAAAHRVEALRSAEPDVWKSAYDAARRQSRIGDMAPYWVYPGEAHIERHVLPLPLSRDLARYEQLKRDLALYRLTFGQPRQEDMLALLASAGLGDQSADRDTIDLRPPTRTAAVPEQRFFSSTGTREAGDAARSTSADEQERVGGGGHGTS
ncbi:helicase-related protein [Micromonospora sp. NPDC002717]|uniref:helicase-related protein n=1 Tax=Micromonospora sp. NPDC002717 TaxID=3154424 RepID=UPI00331FDA5E